MKKLLLLSLLCPLFLMAQTQIGQDIDGESAGDQSGRSVSLSSDGSVVAIGAWLNDDFAGNSGHVRIYSNTGGVWTQVGQDINGEAAGDGSGYSVSLSSDGSIVAIGAGDNDGNGDRSGHVRIYSNIGGVWTQVGQDIDGEAAGDASGWSVSLSSDGSIVAIGAPNNVENGFGSGHVRVYSNIEGVWTQVGQDINGDDVVDGCGYSVSLSSDGSVVAIHSKDSFDPVNDGTSSYVRIYSNIGGVWTQVGQDINGEAAGDWSGFSVSLSSDGSIVAIGAPWNDGNGNVSGHVRVYSNISGVWTQIGQDIDGEVAVDQSGWSISLSSDGSVVAIGAVGNDGNGNNGGHVRVYSNIGGVWTHIGQDINGEAAGDRSGWSVSLSSDGSVVAIGSYINNGSGSESGHVRVYDLSALLSIKDQISLNFSIYPNPTQDQVTIQLQNPSELQSIALYNDLGQLVLTSKETTINTSKLSTGLYVVELETNKGKASKKLIIE